MLYNLEHVSCHSNGPSTPPRDPEAGAEAAVIDCADRDYGLLSARHSLTSVSDDCKITQG